MVRDATRNPYALFGHALRESDWVLAALIARSLEGDARSRRRLLGEMKSASAHRAATPQALNELFRLAELSASAGIAGDPG